MSFGLCNWIVHSRFCPADQSDLFGIIYIELGLDYRFTRGNTNSINHANCFCYNVEYTFFLLRL